ncbi:hypothetical protein ZHAS_00017286 [Anopheles sinensis]|uniref:Uncharacterized protein n=1 Tax=Anopheles sinensis TaxID=74873 RepID=A0A084WFY8_ANOSI|nr:hypothetical protein ZHAS_00017286 [Anopheles sinensis]
MNILGLPKRTTGGGGKCTEVCGFHLFMVCTNGTRFGWIDEYRLVCFGSSEDERPNRTTTRSPRNPEAPVPLR